MPAKKGSPSDIGSPEEYVASNGLLAQAVSDKNSGNYRTHVEMGRAELHSYFPDTKDVIGKESSTLLKGIRRVLDERDLRRLSAALVRMQVVRDRIVFLLDETQGFISTKTQVLDKARNYLLLRDDIASLSPQAIRDAFIDSALRPVIDDLTFLSDFATYLKSFLTSIEAASKTADRLIMIYNSLNKRVDQK